MFLITVSGYAEILGERERARERKRAQLVLFKPSEKHEEESGLSALSIPEEVFGIKVGSQARSLRSFGSLARSLYVSRRFEQVLASFELA